MSTEYCLSQNDMDCAKLVIESAPDDGQAVARAIASIAGYCYVRGIDYEAALQESYEFVYPTAALHNEK